MCGIAGIAFHPDNQQFQNKSLIGASHALQHRGPDDEGYMIVCDAEPVRLFGDETFSDSKLKYSLRPIRECTKPFHVGLVHRRLSIIDLSAAGHQPMCDSTQRFWLVFNGEIYNYKSLRKELEALGHSFMSHSDSEVLLHAYMQWNTQCENYLNGMWAFVIYDSQQETLFASRDRIGVKPLYYAHQHNFLAFASEQIVFHKSGWLPFEVNKEAVFDFLHRDELEAKPEGFFKHIIELPPAHHFIYDIRTGKLELNKYEQSSYNEAIEIPNEQKTLTYIEQVREKTIHAIQEHLQSDVPVGTCLSGGLDSSILVRVIQHLHNEEQHAFHATFSKKEINETHYAIDVVQHTKIKLHTIEPTTEDLAKDLEKVLLAHQLPLRSFSSYAQYRVLQLAAQQGVKVMLDGQGADELFGGYYRYLINYFSDARRAGGKKLVQRLEKEIFTDSAELKKFKNFTLRQYIKAGSLGSILDAMNPSHKLLNKDLFKHHTTATKQTEVYDSLNKRLHTDFYGLYLKEILYREDRNAMAHRIESRVPFADDKALATLVFSIPGLYKIQAGQTKYLLREAFKDLLPPSVYSRRDKLGFASPNNEWMASLKHLWPQYLYNGLNEFFDLKAYKKFLNNIQQHKNKNEDYKTLKWVLFPVWLKVMREHAIPSNV
jgi:asparagine synthase (glutamine-hydrolysing)